MAISFGQFPNRGKGHFREQRCGSTEKCCESYRQNMTNEKVLIYGLHKEERWLE